MTESYKEYQEKRNEALAKPALYADLQLDENCAFGERYAHIIFYLVHPAFDEENRDFQYYSDSDFMYTPRGLDFDDLEIRCQIDNKKIQTPEPCYAWQIGYKDYFTDLGRAENMVHTLKTIHSKLDKYTKEWGYPDSYSAWVLRIAKTLGIQKVYVRSKESGDYIEWKITDLKYLVDNFLSRIRVKWGLESPAE